MNAKTKILIVEDQFVEANHLRLMLRNAGYPVTAIARSVEDAREKISAERPHLVLLDIFLQGDKTGIDLARYLREENIGFIYISANSNESTLNAAKATRPFGFIVKPFRENDLLVSLQIAQQHLEYGLESSMRKERDFHKQLNSLVIEPGTWNERLLKISRALQPLLPFDYVVAIYKMQEADPQKVLSFLRIGFNEYQEIGLEEMQNISRLKVHELKELQENTPIDQVITLYAGKAFEDLTRFPSMKSLMSKCFGMQANLILPIPLDMPGHANFYFSFFSRHPDGFTDEHVGLCERLQQPLLFAIENIRAKDQKAFLVAGAGLPKPLTSAPATIASSELPGFEGIIGRSPQLLNVFDHIMQVAPSDSSVLITGESGTGKERIADCIHRLSPRKQGPLVKINCAALPINLIESELFGHEKGAFTGAMDKRIGKFELAHQGTIFLDEIGEMPLETQVKLLRVLQEKEIERIGGKAPIKVNVRIIAATNRNLEKEVAEGRFRLDLYYRLNVFPIQLPPLRERKDDIVLLAQHFLRYCSVKNGRVITGISDAALASLQAYSWPGNIRELENLIERSVLLTKGPTIENIPLPVTHQQAAAPHNGDRPIKTIEENEREHILAALAQCGGRIRGKGGAAEILGVPPTTLASKMIKLGIKRYHH
ncbi:MAG: sigma 54-interacting transcriptional regulator [Niastella sp.]|nr:sigma 54-interacting transcriptional regulator [Niastella sp.]